MRLYIVRHAFAGQHGDPAYPDDSLRPLTDDGRKQFKRFVAAIAENGFRPSIVATSPYVRLPTNGRASLPTRCPAAPRRSNCRSFAPGSELHALLAWSQQQEGDQTAWVGHSPDVERMTASLLGDKRAAIHFGKGTVAALEFADRRDLAPAAVSCVGWSRPSY